MTESGYPEGEKGIPVPGRPEGPPDGELVVLARRGDRTAFGRLLRRHQRRVFALGLRWFRNADDADDLVQETFIRVWRSLEKFDPDRPFVPWLMTIAVNRAKTFAARARSDVEAVDEQVTVPAGVFLTMRMRRVDSDKGVKTYWYARGVGKVMERDEHEVEMLQSYSVVEQ